jgi:hypothetical protein
MRPLLYSLRARRLLSTSPGKYLQQRRADKPKNGQREIAGQKMVNLLGCDAIKPIAAALETDGNLRLTKIDVGARHNESSATWVAHFHYFKLPHQ